MKHKLNNITYYGYYWYNNKNINECKKYGVADKVEGQDRYKLNGSLIFAHKENLYRIYSDGCVIEIDDYCASGSGFELAIGYLNQSDLTDKKSDIVKAVMSACKTDLHVNYPIIVTNTLDDEFIVIDKE